MLVHAEGDFLVVGPPGPIMAELGKDATLPCSLHPAMSAEDMELRWFRSDTLESVFIYQDRQEKSEELTFQYAGRTSLLGELLSEGEAAVIIHKVQASDKGLYICSFRDGDFYVQTVLELQRERKREREKERERERGRERAWMGTILRRESAL
ncbi:PREDICTED: butyrophilin subfamily 3 member A2-like [Condylura cristata]|uniref:butyrophilin subfamily 3 member A2-like n=1 Tax=Condylura cristata TaxID=143302 RepID=UPI000642CD75|nr:PREDICTED: butyrophilin subfamily 3 member A2-like [Condylura cristata]